MDIFIKYRIIRYYFLKLKGNFYKLNDNWIVYFRTNNKSTWGLECFNKHTIYNISSLLIFITWLQSILTNTINRFYFPHFIAVMKNNNLPLWETYKKGCIYSFQLNNNTGFIFWIELIKLLCINSDVFNYTKYLIGSTITVKKQTIIKLWYNSSDIKYNEMFNTISSEYNYINSHLTKNNFQFTKINEIKY
tara:strand:+ start:1372 stop:1944 length:573 start_codon:yes stop_codon:yes gene_type:complete